jgi:hypothetical protein
LTTVWKCEIPDAFCPCPSVPTRDAVYDIHFNQPVKQGTGLETVTTNMNVSGTDRLQGPFVFNLFGWHCELKRLMRLLKQVVGKKQ